MLLEHAERQPNRPEPGDSDNLPQNLYQQVEQSSQNIQSTFNGMASQAEFDWQRVQSTFNNTTENTNALLPSLAIGNLTESDSNPARPPRLDLDSDLRPSTVRPSTGDTDNSRPLPGERESSAGLDRSNFRAIAPAQLQDIDFLDIGRKSCAEWGLLSEPAVAKAIDCPPPPSIASLERALQNAINEHGANSIQVVGAHAALANAFGSLGGQFNINQAAAHAEAAVSVFARTPGYGRDHSGFIPLVALLATYRTQERRTGDAAALLKYCISQLKATNDAGINNVEIVACQMQLSEVLGYHFLWYGGQPR